MASSTPYDNIIYRRSNARTYKENRGKIPMKFTNKQIMTDRILSELNEEYEFITVKKAAAEKVIALLKRFAIIDQQVTELKNILTNRNTNIVVQVRFEKQLDDADESLNQIGRALVPHTHAVRDVNYEKLVASSTYTPTTGIIFPPSFQMHIRAVEKAEAIVYEVTKTICKIKEKGHL